LYDPDTGAWSSTGDLNETRFNHTATLLPDGKVLVSGGMARHPRQDNRDSGIGSLRSSELYDPDKGTWTFAGSLKTRRFYHTATLLPDGIPLIVGGFSQDPPQWWSVVALDSVELGNTIAAVTPPKITMASVAGKKLIVVGENFYPDSVILINGEEQKTRNDDQNPGTTLIGKKAGKKIKPGDRLQVRNPDDIPSEEFIFTGS
jgi:N-acetylneuraminic acid mutarotase